MLRIIEEKPDDDVEVFDLNEPLMPIGGPYCKEECVNGFCHDGECICIVGYNKVDNGTCQPHCSMGCKNGQCTEPEICECNNGYKPSSRIFDCVPICKSGCAICVQPYTCLVEYLPKIITSTAKPMPTSGTTKAPIEPLTFPSIMKSPTRKPELKPTTIRTEPTTNPKQKSLPKEDADDSKVRIDGKNCEMQKFLETQNLTKDRKLQNIKFVQFWQFEFSD
uniref:EGF-like domain-containing protein n=1 Tax=Megaselia scalaris TaxID=36166 RepID=T1GEA0_MEGSC